MRLLFDQNLSRHLVDRLIDDFPDSVHVSHLGLSRANDVDVWNTARSKGYAIVTKDSDFNDLLLLRGHPPWVIWLRRGNCSTSDIEMLLRHRRSEINKLSDSGNGLLVIQQPARRWRVTSDSYQASAVGGLVLLHQIAVDLKQVREDETVSLDEARAALTRRRQSA